MLFLRRRYLVEVRVKYRPRQDNLAVIGSHGFALCRCAKKTEDYQGLLVAQKE
jgi:hypothetical protein